jgi:putative transposase
MLVHFMMEEHGASQRQACAALSVPRSSYQYEPQSKNDIPVIQELEELVTCNPVKGFWRSYYRIWRKSLIWNHKRIYHVYTAHQLNIRRRFKKRLPARVNKHYFNLRVSMKLVN